MYENNVRLPNVELIKEFANFFDVSIDYLLDNVISSNYESELKEKEVLKHWLRKSGYMSDNEDLSDNELNRLLKFVNANKEFLKGDENDAK